MPRGQLAVIIDDDDDADSGGGKAPEAAVAKAE